MQLPRDYNAAVDLVGRNLAAGRGGKIAYVDDTESCTYAQLAERVDRAANVLRSMDIRREERIAMAMLDSVDWVALFLGAIKAGIVPVAMNTLLTRDDYEYQLRDSRARALFVSEPLVKCFEGLQGPDLRDVVVHAQFRERLGGGGGAGGGGRGAPRGRGLSPLCFWRAAARARRGAAPPPPP